MAELGQTNALRSEINASDHVGAIIQTGLGSGGTPEVSVEFETTKDHPLVTLLSMIASSPDWFVGVSGCRCLMRGAAGCRGSKWICFPTTLARRTEKAFR